MTTAKDINPLGLGRSPYPALSHF